VIPTDGQQQNTVPGRGLDLRLLSSYNHVYGNNRYFKTPDEDKSFTLLNYLTLIQPF